MSDNNMSDNTKINKIFCDICGEEIPKEINMHGVEIYNCISMYNPETKTSRNVHYSCNQNASLWRRIRALESRLDNIDGHNNWDRMVSTIMDIP